MKSHSILALTLLGLAAAPLSRADLLVYEGFDHPAGDNILTPLDGGIGFAGAWTAGQQGGTVTIYDEAGYWDGVVNNVPTSPSTGARYIGGADGDSRITAQRVLSQSAGSLAGDDNILWASIVWKMNGSNFGRQVGFALGTDGLSNRSQNVDTTGNFGAALGDAIGVGGAINTLQVTPTIWDAGTIAVRTTTGATSVSTSLDNLVVLKFVFASGAGLDRVYAYRFTENDTLLETTFDSNAIFAESLIDQDTLNILSFGQSKVSVEAVDEIRLGDTFEDVISGVIDLSSNFQLIITPNGVNYGFTWNSLNGKLYDLVSSPDLATPISTWPVWDGRLNVLPTPPTNTLTDVPGGGDKRFFAVIEKDAGDVDLDPPTLSQSWGSGSAITLVFSEEMAAVDATNPAHYSVVKDGGGAVAVTGATLGADGKTVTLTLGAPLDIASSFAVAINNLTDLAGNPIAAATVGAFQTWDDDPNGVQVFILAGQSNMVGHGKAENGYQDVVGAIGSLRYLAVNDVDAVAPHYRDLLVDPANPATSAWKTRSDVKVWWRDSDIGTPRAVIKGDLKIGYSQSRNSTWYGPEYGFGWQVGDHFTDKPVLIVKCAWGGKSLHVDFRPPSAVAARGGVLGPYYTGMLEYVRDVLSNLETEFPAAQNPEFAAVGYRYRIAGIGWHQGWNDRVDGTASAAYEANLVNLIGDLRAEFGKPALPFSITSTGMDPPATYTAVELAQLAMVDAVKYPAFVGNVKTTDTRPFWRVAAVSPSNFGYHWNHNGESQFLNGTAMGRQMAEMLTPP